MGVKTHPDVGSQVSVVQVFPSSHVTGVFTHPLAGSHESSVQASPSSQFAAGPPVHEPF